MVYFGLLINLFFLTLEVEIRAFPLIKLFFLKVIILLQIHVGTIIGLTLLALDLVEHIGKGVPDSS